MEIYIEILALLFYTTPHVTSHYMSPVTSPHVTSHYMSPVTSHYMSPHTTSHLTLHLTSHYMSPHTTCHLTQHVTSHNMSPHTTYHLTLHVTSHLPLYVTQVPVLGLTSLVLLSESSGPILYSPKLIKDPLLTSLHGMI